MKKHRFIITLFSILLCLSIPCTTVFATNNTNQLTELDANSPVELIVDSIEPPISPQASVRSFHSFTFGEYARDYENELFKIGEVRIDNSHNQYTSASGVFAVNQSGSCGITITLGMSYGGEVDAIFAHAEFQFHGEVAEEVSWTVGEYAEGSITVPPGKIGKITAYIIGMYYGGTATYAVENLATGTVRYENRSIGALIPTKNSWNFVVEIPAE